MHPHLYVYLGIAEPCQFHRVHSRAEGPANGGKNDEQLIAFIRDFLKAVIVILSVLMVLKAAFNQGYRIDP